MRNAEFELNEEGRDFFVGDLHGMYDAFHTELRRVGFDYEVDRVFSVGDLADRGPDSADCLRLLHNDWFHAVRGNHEDFLLGSHTDHVWHMNGGQWGFAMDTHELNELRDLVRERMHRTMTVETMIGTIGVVHAESADDWLHNYELTENNNTWARFCLRTLNTNPIENIDQVVVGHSVVEEPVRLGNILYIDTGSVFGHSLTLLNVHEVFNGDYKVIPSREPKVLTAEEQTLLDCMF